MSDHQRAPFHELLAYVWTHSAFYREYYSVHGIREKDLVDITVRDLPFVSKKTLMDHFDSVVTDPRIRKKEIQDWLQDNPGQVRYQEFIVNCTSGSTGEIGIFLYDQTAVNVMTGKMLDRLPAAENYPSGKTRCACFMNTAAALMPKAVFETVVLSLLDSTDEVVRRLNTFQPHRLTGYSSHLANLADMALQGRLRIRPDNILATGDRLTQSMEQKIRAAWNAPLYDLYCASESIHLGVKAGSEEDMRMMDDLNIVEVLDDRNQPVPTNSYGRVVLTNLYNYTLPVLRYELGDYVVRGTEESETSFSTIRKIHGRINDALPILLDDGSVGSIHPIALADFYVAGLDKLQFVSLASERIRIDYVASQDITAALGREFQLMLDKARARRTAYEVRRVEQIPNDERTGKFRLVRIQQPAADPAIAVSTRSAPKQPATLRSAPISPTLRRATLPLSFSQQRVWFLEKFAPGSLPHMSCAFRLSGALDYAILERSINEIIRRHDILRTGFSEQEGGEPVQMVVTELRLGLSPVDITAHGDEEIDLSRWVQQEIEQPFDLAAAPLMRATLFRRAGDDHLLILVLHHIISDAWSINVLLRELSIYYKFFSGGDGRALPELGIQYGDFAQWQREPRQRGIFDSQLRYWKEQLAGAPHDLEVPMDFRRPAVPSHWPGTETLALGEEFSRAVKNLADSEHSSRFMLLAAVFETLIHRLTGHDDIVIGSTISGRNQGQTDPLIGFFVNVLVLRAKFHDRPSFRSLFRQVRSICLEAYEHQDLPFELLVKELSPERHANRNPLFQYLINMHNLPEQLLDLADVEVRPVEADEIRAPYDLELVVSQRNGELRLSLLYATDLFSAERAGEMLRQYKYLLEQIVDNPDEQIDRYSLITETARQVLPDPTKRLDRTWHGSVPQFLSNHARRNPDRLAVVDAHGAMCYRDLDQRSSRLANYLLDHGVGREDVVAIYADGSANLVWALLGIFKAGAAFVILDPAFPAAWLETYMRQSRPAAWLQIEGAGQLPQELESCLAELSCRCRLTLPDFAGRSAAGLLASYSDEDPKVTIHPDQLAYLAFTSGSTGKPKAVLGLHGSLTHFVPWVRQCFDLNESDRFSALSGISWNQLQREIFTALCCGATLCMPDAETLADPQLLLEWLRREAITVLHIAPAKARLWADFDALAPLALRSVFFGGDELRQCDVEVIKRAAPAATIANHYAATETQRAVGCYLVCDERKKKDPNVSYEGELQQAFPLGQEMPDVQLLVFNKVEGLAGPGELGEIYVRSPHIARGYLDDPELTLARFICNPFTNDPADRLYRTGEFGRFRPDGNIDFVARSESRVNIRGHRIELGEIEAALNGHPAVRESIVVGRGDASNEVIVAYLSLKQDQSTRVDELRSAVKARLPDHMMPSTFMIVDSFPRTPNGKVDRRALPLPDQSRPDLKDVFAAPRTPAEQWLAKLWAGLLQVERVGIHDNFFELGGHSLLATQFVNRLRNNFGVELPLRALFDNPTIEGVALEVIKIQAGGLSGSRWSRMVANWSRSRRRT